jgi:hypothetical protein
MMHTQNDSTVIEPLDHRTERFEGGRGRIRETSSSWRWIAADCVQNNWGTLGYSIGGRTVTLLLGVRVFEPKVKRAAYTKQMQATPTKGISNCRPVRNEATRS